MPKFKRKKMKKLLVLASIFLAIGSASAQKSALDKGGVQLNGGFGFTAWGIPIYAGVDVGVADQVTVGGEVFYRGEKVGGVNYTNFGVLANGNFHFHKVFPLPSQLDVYAGLSLGYYIWDNDFDNRYNRFTSEYDSGIAVRVQTGARYFFTDNFAANGELFIENNVGTAGGLKLGVTYQF